VKTRPRRAQRQAAGDEQLTQETNCMLYACASAYAPLHAALSPACNAHCACIFSRLLPTCCLVLAEMPGIVLCLGFACSCLHSRLNRQILRSSSTPYSSSSKLVLKIRHPNFWGGGFPSSSRPSFLGDFPRFQVPRSFIRRSGLPGAYTAVCSAELRGCRLRGSPRLLDVPRFRL
jgi:hypothetical protein